MLSYLLESLSFSMLHLFGVSNIRKQGHEIIEHWSNEFEIILKNLNVGIQMGQKEPIKKSHLDMNKSYFISKIMLIKR